MIKNKENGNFPSNENLIESHYFYTYFPCEVKGMEEIKMIKLTRPFLASEYP